MYKLLLCARYLRTRYIALASIISVMLGVATMIVVNSVMAGFSTEMRERIHGILADMVLEAVSMDGTPDPERQMRQIQEVAGEYIAAMSPTVEVYGMLSFRWKGGGEYITRPVTIIGIDPVSKAKVGTLTEHLENYKPVRDDEGHLVRAAARNPDDPPNWDLLPAFLEYRRNRINNRNIFHDDDGDEAEHAKRVDAGGDKAAGKRDDDNTPKGLFDDEEPAQGNEDPAAPLPARVYLGYQLVSFPYEDKDTKKVKTVMMVEP